MLCCPSWRLRRFQTVSRCISSRNIMLFLEEAGMDASYCDVVGRAANAPDCKKVCNYAQDQFLGWHVPWGLWCTILQSWNMQGFAFWMEQETCIFQCLWCETHLGSIASTIQWNYNISLRLHCLHFPITPVEEGEARGLWNRNSNSSLHHVDEADGNEGVARYTVELFAGSVDGTLATMKFLKAQSAMDLSLDLLTASLKLQGSLRWSYFRSLVIAICSQVMDAHPNRVQRLGSR